MLSPQSNKTIEQQQLESNFGPKCLKSFGIFGQIESNF